MTKKISRKQIVGALGEMRRELDETKRQASDYLKTLKSFDDVEIPFDLPGEELEMEPDEDLEFNDDELIDDEPVMVETDEDAKTVLDQAIEQIEEVIDHIGDVDQEADTELIASKTKMLDARYGKRLDTLHQKAAKAIFRARKMMAYYGGIKSSGSAKSNRDTVKSNQSDLKRAEKTFREAYGLIDGVKRMFGMKQEATAVPPTGSDFSGDKFPSKTGDPAQVELGHWEDGAKKFHQDVAWENERVNPSVDKRLDTTDYSRDEQPYVNATFHYDKNNRFSSYWDVIDTKSGKRMKIAFDKTPESLRLPDTSDEQNFKLFGSRQYGRNLANHVKSIGVNAVKVATNAVFATPEGYGAAVKAISKVAKEEVKEKGMIREYYGDAFGDPEYARKLVSRQRGQTKKAEHIREQGKDDPEYGGYHDGKNPKPTGTDDAKPKSDSREDLKAGKKEGAGNIPDTHQSEEGGIRIGYDPKDQHPVEKNKGLDTGEAKDGPGKITKQDRDVMMAKARRSTELAFQLAARGGIAFDRKSVYAKAAQYYKLPDDRFEIVEATVLEMPIVKESVLKSAELPDAETGVVGNPLEGVRDPQAKADATDGDKTVEQDADAAGAERKSGQQDANAKTSALVPQMQQDNQPNIKKLGGFTSIADRLKRVGVDPNAVRKAQYKNR